VSGVGCGWILFPDKSVIVAEGLSNKNTTSNRCFRESELRIDEC
jgi:hypothetical protein